MKTAAILRREFPELKISENVSYREITSLGIGSALLPVLAEPADCGQLTALLRYLHRRQIKVFILGAGTNLVGMDTPYDGVMIKISGKEFSKVVFENDLTVRCGAFARLPVLASLCAKSGLSGLAPLSGIPGTIGGALRMNAGANGVEIGMLVKELSGVRFNGKRWRAAAGDMHWVYRGSDIPADVVITEAVFQLTAGDIECEEDAILAETEKRRQREPGGRTAGCAFRNVSDLDPAGKLIDQCGLRGFRVGDLIVSEKHANYLVNTGKASEADYLRMIRILRRAVSEKHGFYLTTEIVPVNPAVAGDIETDTPSPLINVLYGGVSSEREVSLKSGTTVATALRKAGFKVELSDIRSCEITDTMVQSDVVYPVLHGGFGEDGELQKKLENARLRFVGSSSVSSALVMDKIATKRLLDEISLPTAPWAVINKRNRSFPENLQFPVVVKAPCEGSSVGVVKVSSADEWDNALDAEFKLADELLVEEFLPGAEITVPVINASALEVIEIVPPSSDFYTWDAKYDYKNGETQYFCPPKTISDNSRKLAREYALKFYHAAGCRDILRVDFIVGSDGVPRILEGNSLPGNTDHSLVPKAARQAGISMEKMCATLVYAAMKRSGDVNQVKKISFWGLAIKKLQKFADGILNLASLLTGLTLGWAGMRFDRSMLSASALLTGGILLVFLAVTRTLDRKK
ncbi:MAG: D-alanine--D-alanine ligase [Lentisphaeria bacterium]|nr:D-alanine--D-alanine ligase [Lentisphaeria bacterium]